jgi:hypothetical protein
MRRRLVNPLLRVPPQSDAARRRYRLGAPTAQAARTARAIGSFSSLAAFAKKIAWRSASEISRSLISSIARGLSEVSGGASLP